MLTQNDIETLDWDKNAGLIPAVRCGERPRADARVHESRSASENARNEARYVFLPQQGAALDEGRNLGELFKSRGFGRRLRQGYAARHGKRRGAGLSLGDDELLWGPAEPLAVPAGFGSAPCVP